MVETDALKRNASRNKTKEKDDVTQNNPTVGETSREERGHEPCRRCLGALGDKKPHFFASTHELFSQLVLASAGIQRDLTQYAAAGLGGWQELIFRGVFVPLNAKFGRGFQG